MFKTAQGYLARQMFKCVYLFFFIITAVLKSECLILIKLKELMVAIGMKLGPGDHESSLKNLQVVPVPLKLNSKLNCSAFAS